MPHDFVVLSSMRCGSYHLVSMLDSADDLVCYGEVYKPRRVELPRPMRRRLGLKKDAVEARDRMGRGLIDGLRQANRGKGVGFKLFTGHVANGPPDLKAELYSGRLAVVVLSRPPLEAAVSLAAGRAHKAMTQREGDKPDYSPVTVTPERLDNVEDALARLDRMAGRLRDTPGVRTFRISYAELNDPARLQAVLDFLGSTARAEGLASSYQRQSRGGLHARAANWAELVAHMQDQQKTHLLAEAGYDRDGNPLNS